MQRLHGNQFVQRKLRTALSQHPVDDFGARLSAACTGGAPLSPRLQRQLEPTVGGDLSLLRVHTDDSANTLSSDVGALAFTSGEHVFFSAGTFEPDSAAGRELLVHEAAHVVQQAAGPVAGEASAGGIAVSHPSDALEQAAERVAAAAPPTEATPLPSTVETTLISPVTESAPVVPAGAHGLVQRQAAPAPPAPPPPADASAPASDETILKDVDTYSDSSLAGLETKFNNALSGFQNWYFDKDEGDEAFFTEFQKIVSDASNKVSPPGTPLSGPVLITFTDASAQIETDRTHFLTSLTVAIGKFRENSETELIGKTGQRLHADLVTWQRVTEPYNAHGDWHAVLHALGLPRPDDTLDEQLLSDLIFAYRRWELGQHSAMYRGLYSMSDPDLKLMQAGAKGEAHSILANPRINYGDVVLKLPTYTVFESRYKTLAEDAQTLADLSVRLPLFEALGVNLTGALSGGYHAGVKLGPIEITDIHVGLSYSQVPAVFNVLGEMMLLDGLGGLRALSSLFGLRLRGAGMLHAAASADANVFLKAALRLALDAGVSTDLSVDLASIEGHLGAEAGALFGADFFQDMDIIIDHGQMAFTAASSLELSQALMFKLTGGIKARILTFSWEKDWTLADLLWDQNWVVSSDMNMIYANGIKGDPDKVIDFGKLANILGKLEDIGKQTMNAGPPSTSTPSTSTALQLRWPKPPAANYPLLYITTRGETRSQTELRNLFESGDPNVDEYSPLEQKGLPHASEEIGLAPENQLGPGNNHVGPLSTGDTPGGDRINRLLRDYGINPQALNGDHVYEIQMGGQDRLDNLWPLEAALNKGGGSAIDNATVIDPSTSPPQTFKVRLLKQVVDSTGQSFFFEIISFA
jgi:hypothetical protein